MSTFVGPVPELPVVVAPPQGQFRRFGDLSVDEVLWVNRLFTEGYRNHHVHELLNLTIRDVQQHRRDLMVDPSQPRFTWGVPPPAARKLEDLFSVVSWDNSSVEVECWRRLQEFVNRPGRDVSNARWNERREDIS